jgi:hypothetical protein
MSTLPKHKSRPITVKNQSFRYLVKDKSQGALNIDPSRVSPVGSTPGRFPTNLLLTHSKDCSLLGTKEVKGKKPETSTSPTKNTVYGKYPKRSLEGFFANQDGLETIDSWDCSCHIKELDNQSGIRKGTSGGGVHKKGYKGGIFGGVDSPNTARGDSGGASRFFIQLSPETLPFFYTQKISAKERKEDSNTHPTPKSRKLMSYLIKLVTPEGGKVLDPFCGSGSTLVAAYMEGFDSVGIELEKVSFNIAKSRIDSLTTPNLLDELGLST